MPSRKEHRQPLLEREPRLKEPSRYRVLLLNDDFTPMDYVVQVLQQYFHKTHEEAVQIMLEVHHKGRGICGVYPYDMAETKVALVTADARQHQHPLRCTMEKE